MSNIKKDISFLKERVKKHKLLSSRELQEYFNFAFVANYLLEEDRYMRSRIIEIGCGVDLRLVQFLYQSDIFPEWYLAVDKEPLVFPYLFRSAKWRPHLAGSIRFPYSMPKMPKENTIPNIAIVFNVLEHVKPGNARKILSFLREIMPKGSRVFLHTHPWETNAKYLSEYTNLIAYKAMGSVLNDCGFKVLRVIGTIMDVKEKLDSLDYTEYKDYENKLNYYGHQCFDVLKAHDYPHLAKSILWVLETEESAPVTDRAFDELEDTHKPWASHPLWAGLK